MKEWIIILIIVIQLPVVSAVFSINEIFPAPSDTNEWVELYNNNTTENITQWNISDNTHTDTFQCCPFSQTCNLTIAPLTYIVILDLDSTAPFRSEPNVYCVDDNSIGNGLGDISDTITIAKDGYHNTKTYDEQNQVAKNYSHERREDNSWVESLAVSGTPLLPNSVWNLSTSYQNLQINEILANPLGSDDQPKPNGEWIEIYNNSSKSIDLRALYFLDSAKNSLPLASTNTIPGLVLCPNCFVQVFRDGDNDFSLNNNEDSITLIARKNSREIFIQDFSYARTTEGMTWNRIPTGWYEASPTPQLPNEITAQCEYNLELSTNKIITTPAELNISISIIHKSGPSANITIRGAIIDENQNVIRNYSPWTRNIIVEKSTKTYSPNLPLGVYSINFWIEQVSCTDITKEDKNVSVPIVLKSAALVSQESTELVTFKVPAAAKKGQIIPISISLHKGNTKSSIIKLWLEQNSNRITPISEIKIENKNQDYSLKLPFLIPCTAKEEKGKIKLEGLGFEEQEEIEIKGATE